MAEQDNDHRKYLEEKFNSINNSMSLQFEGICKTLSSIETQTKLTNGKVLKLQDDVVDLKINEKLHMGGQCPQAETFKEIKKSIQEIKDEKNSDTEINFIRKYPKLSLGIVVASCLIIIFSYTGFMSMKQSEKVGQENVVLNEQIIKNQEIMKKLEITINKIDTNNPKAK